MVGPPEFLALVIFTAALSYILFASPPSSNVPGDGGVILWLAYVCRLILFRNAFFAGRRNIVGAGPLKDFFGTLNFITVF
jgi:hypothetical protein